MKIGDLVMKRWGKIEVFQQDTVGIYLGKYGSLLRADLIRVAYPGHSVGTYKKGEFQIANQVR